MGAAGPFRPSAATCYAQDSSQAVRVAALGSIGIFRDKSIAGLKGSQRALWAGR